ncbi:MAG TPA: sugar ABC transporter substrate-binding protein [Solirubrobacteraceae bacterium]
MSRFRNPSHGRARIASAILIATAALAIGVGTSGASTTPKLAMIVAANNQNAFQEMADGAKVAAAQQGDQLTSSAPASTTDDGTTQVTEFQSAETTSPDGIGIMTTIPPDFGTVEAQAESSGIPVVAVDACPVPTSNVPTCVANNNELVGEGIANALVKSGKIKKGQKGVVVVGDDIPQLQLLGLRIAGMEKVLKAYDPNLTFTANQNVTADPTTNEQAWASLVAKYPKAVLYIAPGDQDAVSFVAIENQTHKHYLTIACDVDPTAIHGVQDGEIFGLGDPYHFMKGYIAMYILNKHARGGKLITGWWDPGSGVITKANINAIIKRETNNTTRYAFYKPLIKKELANPSKYIGTLAAAGEN